MKFFSFLSLAFTLSWSVWGFTAVDFLQLAAKNRGANFPALKESASLNKFAQVLLKTQDYKQATAVLPGDLTNLGSVVIQIAVNPKTKKPEIKTQSRSFDILTSNTITSIGYYEQGAIAVLAYAYIPEPLLLDMDRLVQGMAQWIRVKHNPQLSEMAKRLTLENVSDVTPFIADPNNLGFSCAKHRFTSMQDVADYFAAVVPSRYKEIGAAVFKTNNVCMVFKS